MDLSSCYVDLREQQEEGVHHQPQARPSKDPEMDLPGSGDVPDVLLNEQLQLPHMDLKNHQLEMFSKVLQ